MSSAAAAPERAGRGDPAVIEQRTGHGPITPDVIAGVGGAAALVAVAFLTSSSAGQTVTAGNTWTEIVITLLGAGVVAGVIVAGGRGRAWGAITVGLCAALTALEAASIAWSVQPDWSWFGANQMLAYLAAFAAAAGLARLAPQRWPAVVGSITVAAALLSGWSLLAKVFPATLAAANAYGRLQAPFGYWNALGACAALGLPGALWAGCRRRPRRGRALVALAVPAMTLMISVIVLSYSRSALAAALVAVALWLALAPQRMRSILLLAIGTIGAVPIILWMLARPALSSDNQAPSLQDAAGHRFGLILLVVLVVVTAAGYATALAMDRITVPPAVQRRIGTALAAVVALIPVLAVAGLAASSRGLTGEISHAWNTLTNPSAAQPGDTAGRIGQLGSSRPLYWHQGLTVGEHHLLAGAGELGYGVARLRYTTSPDKVDQAHSYLVQTFADLGLVGLALTLALLVAWVVSAARALALRTRWQALAPAAAAEREGLAVLAIVVVAFGIQSALDWTWYFPGVSVPALVAAGWLAGRGPLTAPVGLGRLRRSLLSRPGAGFAIVALAALALLACWVLWQPLRSAQQLTAAENARTNPRAFVAARAAAGSDPLSYAPLQELSLLYQSVHDPTQARAALMSATRRQSENPQTWFALGQFDLQSRNWRAALPELRRVIALDATADPTRSTATQGIVAARAALDRQIAAARHPSRRAKHRRHRR